METLITLMTLIFLKYILRKSLRIRDPLSRCAGTGPWQEESLKKKTRARCPRHGIPLAGGELEKVKS